MTPLESILLGLVQGLTEFLPVSSSAHLIVLPRALGWDDELINSSTFVVMLHMGTLGALLVFFWRDVLKLTGAYYDEAGQSHPVALQVKPRRISDTKLGWRMWPNVVFHPSGDQPEMPADR